jgi:uncharacterized damage-inducible protein DinB
MIEEIRIPAYLYDANTTLVKRAFRGLNHSQMTSRPLETGNSMQWVLGHLINSRYTLCNYLGTGLAQPFEKKFSRGSKISEIAQYPSPEDLLQTWKSISQELKQRFQRVTPELLAQPLTVDFPVPEKTVRGAVFFLHLHESYHVGQLGYVRVLVGASQLVG